MRRKLFFLLHVIFFSSVLYAQPNNVAPGESYAIVVGISNYHYIKPLSYADRDAELFTELLRSGAGGSIKSENMVLLKNDSANAGNFWSSISRLCNKKLNRGDRVYIYFAGHGDAVKGLNEYYLLLSDCQPANDGNNYLLSLGAIDMYHLKNRIGLLTMQGVEVVLVLDACRTNELPGGYASQAFNTSVIQANVGDITMLATGPGEVSVEHSSFGSGHGIFTYNLVDALSGRADKEDGGNNDAVISLAELKKWVTKNVRQNSEKFNVKQDPVFCCDEKNNTVIGKVDSNFDNSWKKFKELSESNSESFPGTKSNRSTGNNVDTAVSALYNKFNEARKQSVLWGENSADNYYEQLKERFPGNEITEDARYVLASDFINFAQQKINLYLEGKDLLSIENLREKNDSIQSSSFLSDEYERLQNTVSEKWTITARMIEKAGKLLSTKGDSSLFYQLKPRIGFLFARGYVSREKENKLRFEDALKYAEEAYKADSNAAYTAECLGIVLAYEHSFSRGLGIEEYELGTSYKSYNKAMTYLQKAVQLAPKWVNPYRSIALKIYGEFRNDSALVYMYKALALNPDDGTTHVIIGDLYRQIHPDSAMYYYRKALTLSGKSSYAMIYRKMARVFLEAGYTRNSPAFKPDSILVYSRLSLGADLRQLNDHPSLTDEALATIYMDIASMYSMQQRPDSAIAYYFKVIGMFPDHEKANLGIVGYYYTRSPDDKFLGYSYSYLKIAPQNETVLSSLANYYYNKGMSDSAIIYYQRILPLTKSPDMPRERLAYMLMEKDKNDTKPLDYLLQTLKEFPFAWRSYYQIARYYSNRQEADKSIEYLEKALQKGMKDKKQIENDALLVFIRNTDPYKNLMAKYFP